ncbi:MAG: lipid-A-disaccharide synthase [Alphaproteobacteria bacterium]|nr:lipid-A-disaccharide synthase [Alphaproteobacteria bacterium]
MALHCYLVAGEASGDALGAGLMAALKAQTAGDVRFSGVGGEKMEAEGLASLFPYHELSLMGFVEIVPHLITLHARINLVAEDIIAKQPDVVVTIDSPGFNFRLADRLRKSGSVHARLVHYVAPTVWAYKPERAARCAQLFDHLLCLLPFEPPYFEAEGLAATFVGHPVAYQAKGDGRAFREKYQMSAETPLLALLPGSREGEIRRHMPIFAPAIVKLAETHPGLAIAAPVHQRLLPMLAKFFKGCPLRAVVVSDDQDRRGALAASTIALAKSGTVSLEVAQAGVPQIVAYRAHPVSAWVLRRMINIPQVNLINIMAGEEVIPELLQEDCTSSALAEALEALMNDPQAAAHQVEIASAQLEKLRIPGDDPATRAAKVVLNLPKG